MHLPSEIDQKETLLRSLRKGDVNRALGIPKVSAMKPGGDRTELSLIRERIGFGEAAEAAVKHVHGTEFFAFGSAAKKDLDPHCLHLVDDRATFFGHANMELGYSLPKGPPDTPPEMTSVYEEAMKRLRDLAATFRVEQVALNA